MITINLRVDARKVFQGTERNEIVVDEGIKNDR